MGQEHFSTPFFQEKGAKEVTQKIISIDGSDDVQRLIISFSDSTNNDFKLWVWWGELCSLERQSNPLIHFVKNVFATESNQIIDSVIYDE